VTGVCLRVRAEEKQTRCGDARVQPFTPDGAVAVVVELASHADLETNPVPGGRGHTT